MFEFLNFVRIKVCVFCVFISISGFLLFNNISINLLFVILGMFFLCASVCAYNSITDKEEDAINKKKVNPLALIKKGYFIVIFCFIAGLTITLLTLSLFSSIIYLLSLFAGFVYSFLRLKQYLLLKNLYSGFSWGLSFLFGASTFSHDMFAYYIIISMFIFINSILSDLRDFKGDKAYNIITIPVNIGYKKCNKK